MTYSSILGTGLAYTHVKSARILKSLQHPKHDPKDQLPLYLLGANAEVAHLLEVYNRFSATVGYLYTLVFEDKLRSTADCKNVVKIYKSNLKKFRAQGGKDEVPGTLKLYLSHMQQVVPQLTGAELRKRWVMIERYYTDYGVLYEADFSEPSGKDLQESFNLFPHHNLHLMFAGFSELDRLAQVDLDRPFKAVKKDIMCEMSKLGRIVGEQADEQLQES